MSEICIKISGVTLAQTKYFMQDSEFRLSLSVRLLTNSCYFYPLALNQYRIFGVIVEKEKPRTI
jgi:hypothetical protein